MLKSSSICRCFLDPLCWKAIEAPWKNHVFPMCQPVSVCWWFNSGSASELRELGSQLELVEFCQPHDGFPMFSPWKTAVFSMKKHGLRHFCPGKTIHSPQPQGFSKGHAPGAPGASDGGGNWGHCSRWGFRVSTTKIDGFGHGFGHGSMVISSSPEVTCFFPSGELVSRNGDFFHDWALMVIVDMGMA